MSAAATAQSSADESMMQFKLLVARVTSLQRSVDALERRTRRIERGVDVVLQWQQQRIVSFLNGESQKPNSGRDAAMFETLAQPGSGSALPAMYHPGTGIAGNVTGHLNAALVPGAVSSSVGAHSVPETDNSGLEKDPGSKKRGHALVRATSKGANIAAVAVTSNLLPSVSATAAAILMNAGYSRQPGAKRPSSSSSMTATERQSDGGISSGHDLTHSDTPSAKDVDAFGVAASSSAAGPHAGTRRQRSDDEGSDATSAPINDSKKGSGPGHPSEYAKNTSHPTALHLRSLQHESSTGTSSSGSQSMGGASTGEYQYQPGARDWGKNDQQQLRSLSLATEYHPGDFPHYYRAAVLPLQDNSVHSSSSGLTGALFPGSGSSGISSSTGSSMLIDGYGSDGSLRSCLSPSVVPAALENIDHYQSVEPAAAFPFSFNKLDTSMAENTRSLLSTDTAPPNKVLAPAPLSELSAFLDASKQKGPGRLDDRDRKADVQPAAPVSLASIAALRKKELARVVVESTPDSGTTGFTAGNDSYFSAPVNPQNAAGTSWFGNDATGGSETSPRTVADDANNQPVSEQSNSGPKTRVSFSTGLGSLNGGRPSTDTKARPSNESRDGTEPFNSVFAFNTD
jgi:hypothetical protein